MPTVAFTTPVLVGKTELFQRAQAHFVIDRRKEFESSRRRLGITAEQGFLQHTASGDVAIVVFDMADPASMLAGMASSMEPIDVEFRQYLRDVFGIDLTLGPPAAPAEQVFAWRQDEGKKP